MIILIKHLYSWRLENKGSPKKSRRKYLATPVTVISIRSRLPSIRRVIASAEKGLFLLGSEMSFIMREVTWSWGDTDNTINPILGQIWWIPDSRTIDILHCWSQHDLLQNSCTTGQWRMGQTPYWTTYYRITALLDNGWWTRHHIILDNLFNV